VDTIDGADIVATLFGSSRCSAPTNCVLGSTMIFDPLEDVDDLEGTVTRVMMCTAFFDCVAFRWFAAAVGVAIRPPAAIAAACIEEETIVEFCKTACFFELFRALFGAFGAFGGGAWAGFCCLCRSGAWTCVTGRGMVTGTCIGAGTGACLGAAKGAAADFTSGVVVQNTVDVY
jgi:hypothetical protein